MISVIIILIIIVIWVYYVQFRTIPVNKQLFVDDVINNDILKTGDLILFKAYNNINSLFHGSYFGHIGIVYKPKGQQPMLFEANGIEFTPLKPHHNKNGVFLTPLADRVKKYKGRCYIKPLAKELNINHDEFLSFIEWCIQNMYYDYNVIISGISKYVNARNFDLRTDCAQIIFITLIKLGLLDPSELDKKILNHLIYLSDLKKIKDNEYMDLIEMIDHPYAF